MTLAMVFPGQGSQSVGMLADLAERYSCVKHTFDEASDSLGFDLWNLVQAGPEKTLGLTENTQPAMLAAGYAVWRVWRECGGPMPVCMAGHSLGEYTALVAAGAFDFPGAAKLVADRGSYMAQAVPPGEGAIAAIVGLGDAAVQDLCTSLAQGEVLEAVNFNAPGQVAVAGTTVAVERLLDQAKSAGAKRAVRLPVSVPVHSSLMAPAAKKMEERLQLIDIHTPKIPVLHNFHLKSEREPEAIRKALVAQIDAPVRWAQTVCELTKAGVSTIIECGPGKVLTGLNRRIDRDVEVQSLNNCVALDQALATRAS